MDQIRTGALIRRFRTAKRLTQKQLAERLHVSAKAVSKWECGNGSPDISLLPGLAEALGTEIRVLLAGEIEQNEREKGDMKKLRFYVCKACGNLITASGDAAVTCCGSRLPAAEPRQAAEQGRLCVEEIDGEWYVSSGHPMTKEHYVSFAAYVGDSTAMIFRQYPEWNLQFTMPLYRTGRLLWYCTKCGLLYQDLG